MSWPTASVWIKVSVTNHHQHLFNANCFLSSAGRKGQKWRNRSIQKSCLSGTCLWSCPGSVSQFRLNQSGAGVNNSRVNRVSLLRALQVKQVCHSDMGKRVNTRKTTRRAAPETHTELKSNNSTWTQSMSFTFKPLSYGLTWLYRVTRVPQSAAPRHRRLVSVADWSVGRVSIVDLNIWGSTDREQASETENPVLTLNLPLNPLIQLQTGPWNNP